MAKMEHVIKGLWCIVTDGKCDSFDCPYWEASDCIKAVSSDALALLKEQEEREQRICKSICNFIRGACSTDTDDDKDFVCYEIQKCFTEGR